MGFDDSTISPSLTMPGRSEKSTIGAQVLAYMEFLTIISIVQWPPKPHLIIKAPILYYTLKNTEATIKLEHSWSAR